MKAALFNSLVFDAVVSKALGKNNQWKVQNIKQTLIMTNGLQIIARLHVQPTENSVISQHCDRHVRSVVMPAGKEMMLSYLLLSLSKVVKLKQQKVNTSLI